MAGLLSIPRLWPPKRKQLWWHESRRENATFISTVKLSRPGQFGELIEQIFAHWLWVWKQLVEAGQWLKSEYKYHLERVFRAFSTSIINSSSPGNCSFAIKWFIVTVTWSNFWQIYKQAEFYLIQIFFPVEKHTSGEKTQAFSRNHSPFVIEMLQL